MISEEMLKMLKEINEKLEKATDTKTEKLKFIEEQISEAFNEPAEISIIKDAEGQGKTHLSGKALPILITLAGLEKCVLEKLDVPNDVWELIKETVGVKGEEQ